MVARVHPELQDEVLARLLANAQREPATATALREFCEQFFERRMEEDSYVSSELRLALTEQAMLCGRLDDATRYLQLAEGPLKQFYEAAIAALRGEQAGAIVAFEAALKALRRESGKRKQLFEGMGGHLYILALLRSGDAKHLKSAETYLDSALRAPHNHDTAVYQQLNLLRQIRASTLQADVVHGRAWEAPLQAQMFQSLLYYWLSLPELNARGAELQELAQHAEQAGFQLIAGQAAALLGHQGDAEQARRAAALRARLGFADMAVVRAPGSMAAPAHGADQSSTSCGGRLHRRDAAGLDAGLRCPPRPDRRRAARTKARRAWRLEQGPRGRLEAAALRIGADRLSDAAGSARGRGDQRRAPQLPFVGPGLRSRSATRGGGADRPSAAVLERCAGDARRAGGGRTGTADPQKRRQAASEFAAGDTGRQFQRHRQQGDADAAARHQHPR